MTVETQLSEARGALSGGQKAVRPGKRRIVWTAAAVLAAALAAVVIAAALLGGARHTARGLVRALAEGDGGYASELLPGDVLRHIAGEAGTDEEQARAGVENALAGLVGVYGEAPKGAKVTAGESRELTGEELSELRELYGQIGLELKKAAGVEVSVDTGNGAAGTVQVTVVKLGLRWYADYTSLDDTAYRIAHLGK